jgi:hypothetical protein
VRTAAATIATQMPVTTSIQVAPASVPVPMPCSNAVGQHA